MAWDRYCAFHVQALIPSQSRVLQEPTYPAAAGSGTLFLVIGPPVPCADRDRERMEQGGAHIAERAHPGALQGERHRLTKATAGPKQRLPRAAC